MDVVTTSRKKWKIQKISSCDLIQMYKPKIKKITVYGKEGKHETKSKSYKVTTVVPTYKFITIR